MPKAYHHIRNFTGLSNAKDPRDITGLSKAQNISLDKGGKIRTIGGLETHGEVPTHAAVLCPGAGLFPYGSDHWRGTDTIVDLLANSNATADQQTEANATTGWSNHGTPTLSSTTPGAEGIASNGTTYIMKIVADTIEGATQAFTTVIGQHHKASADIYIVEAGNYMSVFIGTSAGGNQIAQKDDFTVGSWTNIEVEFVATATTTYITIMALFDSPPDSLYTDDVYVTAIPQPDLDTTWLALADVATAQIDLWNRNDFTAFSANALNFGTVASFVGAALGNVDFPTTNTITDSASSFLNGNIKAGRVYKISGCSTTTANNLLFVCDRVNASTIIARGNPFTVTAAEVGTVTLTEYNPTDFHFVDDSLSVSPVGGGVALRPKQYRFVDRIHLKGADSSEAKYQDWYLNDVGLVAPTDISAEADAGDQDASALSAGLGFEVGITTTADGGEWPAGTYIIANSFILDDGQESELYIPSTDEEFGTVIVDNDSLTITARVKGPYDERISGGRIYARLDESDDPWVLLVDISMEQGARATLSGQYNSWNESATATVAYSIAFKSIRSNVDTYEGLTGSTPDAKIEKFTSDNRFWDASVIAGNRCFIFGPRYTDDGGKTVHFRDRIIYSKINRYDVFPIDNYIDVTGSDAEDYVAGGVYGSDLLAFKHNTLYIIDISDPLEFRMKEDSNKGKHPFRGISHPGAYFETPHGPAWCNQFGIWLYDGNAIVDLLGDRIERSKHPLAYQGYMTFDGTNDYISKSNNANLNFGASTDFSIEAWFRSSASTDQDIIHKGGWTTSSYYMRIKSDGTFQVFASDAVPNSAAVTSTGTVNDGEWHHGVATFDRDGNLIGYVDAVSVGTPTSLASVGDIDSANPFAVGIRSGNLSSDPFNGDIALVRIWNRVLSSAEIALLAAGQPVAAADQWGSQTDITPTGQAWSDSNTEGNSVAGLTETLCTISSVTAAGETPAATHAGTWMVKMALASGSSYCGDSFSTVIGEKYRASGWCYVPAGTGGFTQLRVGTSLNNNDLGSSTYTTRDAWTYVQVEYTATTTTTYISSLNSASSGSMYVDDVVNVQIGCVLELLPENFTDATAVDSSDNSLDATVVGATFIYPDTWEHFWTDYSILGYHGKTNQLIVMRDCTGNWSSGADYGDCWIVDLDTLFHTTGRRVFPANVPFTNFATDWNGDLIIGRQSGANIITEKWTDKPQSQAVGLIDIRTADIDFDNPAIIDIIDAFVANYKSSAAQTNPISYALDGDDRPNAWTAITGNFDAEGFWEEFLAQPTSFECKTLRLRITNPTNAGTLEINELVIRHDPQTLKLSYS